MRTLNVRQGATAGIVISMVLAAAIAGRSSDPLPTFVYVLAVSLSTVALMVLWLVAFNRRAQRPKDR